MHFSDNAAAKGSQFTKIAIVAALHVAVGAAVMKSMDSKMFDMPKVMEELVMITPEIPKPPPPPPPPPPEPPKQRAKPVTQPPKVHVPKVEVEVPQEPTVEAPVVATTEPAPAEPAQPGPVTPEAEPTPPAPPAPPAPARKGGKLLALTNASDCATPEYPASAARNGETGTVSLALLIGADGRVTDSKIQKSSGSRALDKAAQAALSMCKFKPATNDGEAEEGWGQIAYVWNLD